MSKQFDNKVALITGAASGIGKTTAIAFAERGAKVIISDINEKDGEETALSIQKNGAEARFIKADVSKHEDVKNLMDKTIDFFGKIDIAVNNAGIGGEWNRIVEYSFEDWDRVIAINQSGVFYCLKYEIQQMLKQESGAIVNISSIAGLRGLANSAAYSASKHAVIGMTKSAALEYARKNIRINAVCPVFTLTPLFKQMFEVNETYETRLKENIPMKRYGTTDDIAHAILWLCSEESSFITGQALALDGGMTAN